LDLQIINNKMAQIKNTAEVKSNRLFMGIYDPKFGFKDKNYINIKEGDVVYSRGEKSEYMYLVVNGRIKLKTYENPRQPKVFLVSKDEFFGEKELLDKTNRNSSAVAEKDTSLFRINHKDFIKLCSNGKILANLKEQKYEEVIAPSRKTDIKEDIFKRIINEPEPVIRKEKGIEIKDYSYENPLLELKARDEINEENKIFNEDEEEPNLKDSDLIIDEDGVTWDIDLDELKEEVLNSQDDNISDDTVIKEEKAEDKNIVDNFFKMQEQVNELSETLDKIEVPDAEHDTPEPVPVRTELDSGFISAVFKIVSGSGTVDAEKLILEGCTELVNAESGVLYFPEDDGLLRGRLFEEGTEITAGSDTLPGKCLESGEIINIKDVFNDSNFNPAVDYISYFHIHSVICIPVKSEENVKAVLQLFNSRNGEFSDYDQQLLTQVSPLILKSISSNDQLVIEETFFDEPEVKEEPAEEPGIAEIPRQEAIEEPVPVKGEKEVSLRVLSEFLIQEFQGIISDIKQFNKYLQRIDIPGETKEVSDVVTSQTSKILDLLEVLKDYAKPEKVIQAEKKSYVTVFDDMVGLLAEYTEQKKVNLYKKFEDDAEIMADSKSLYLAVFQLIKYQCDLMPFGGNLFISSLRTDNSIEILLKNATKKTDESLVIAKPIEYNEETPSGIGLSLARKIIEDHNAVLEVKNQTGTGLEIGIIFPLA
jgi:hypothetical protein